MDLFPDWSEIATIVKLALFAVWLCATVLIYALASKIGTRWNTQIKASLVGGLSLAMGVFLFVSMFLFDWASLLR